ncbi:glycosyltransferase family 52 [Butyrivibrio sp. MC2013]|uniref:glycosyltransferase family 52 n=1 Tax=Butyrivibrio sp. MC2013 TaxID=1280686 RepID=UPI0004064DA1|nr:glycosyltransferase family 52 [Butyrivibrio sp. MC2013]
MAAQKDRIYICHTFYHAYVAYLKELAFRRNGNAGDSADLMISLMSNDFGDFKDRAVESGIWDRVIEFDEKKPGFYPELDKLSTDKGNIASNMISRIRYCRKLGQLTGERLPVDLRLYRSIYVFCDSDPIGYYLDYAHIPYHAVEDGLNCLVTFDAAYYDNRGHFGLKSFFSKKLGLIHIQNGYGKYCLDMEVNDISVLKRSCPYYVELKRSSLIDALSVSEKEMILKAFVREEKEIRKALATSTPLDNTKQDDQVLNTGEASAIGSDKTLILTEPLCDLETRKRLFDDIVSHYKAKGTVFIKPHPRDELDYTKLYPFDIVFDPMMPMEMLSFFEGVHFDRVVSVYTNLDGINYADKKVRLGNSFMDRYEDASAHIQNNIEEDDPLD